ncbi:MAG: CRISPR-associated helicase Cas3' [Bacteroidales bacterium]|nr:CRISPR-associated helicase Cas3' [Bacteroidales bacterium]
MKEIISHIRKTDDWEIQTNEAHQQGVANLASQFAAEFGMSEWGKVIGLLHDKGKEKKAFQQHIIKESGLDSTVKVEGDYRHAYVGALIAKTLFPKQHLLMDNVLMGHHRGLYDDGDMKEVMKLEMPNDVSVEKIDAVFEIPQLEEPVKGYQKDIHHLERMLYSCLVDADFLDTEAFTQPEQSKLRGNHESLKVLEGKLDAYLSGLKKNAPDTEVNRIRNEVQQWCIKESERSPGFYSLTVPTGGGKTLSSVLWAIKHAVKNDLKRILIAIPYTSIITQTASVLRNIFGEENVLEHHSNVDRTKENDKELSQKQRLATENWDYPIIVTTNVQLFESLFSNRPSDCRKLHSIAKSVLILDEVQTLPMDFLQPIIDTFDTLKRVFGVSILFTTASQPVLSGKILGSNPFVSFEGLTQIHEIVPREANLHNRLRRVKIEFEDGDRKDYDEVTEQIAKHSRVLCIVNTRNDAKEIYSRLPKDGICLHLSRMMCPDHVRETIDMVKAALKDPSNNVIRVVATQLIEAGVDIDFPVVFRQEAGLDSILQAAGRCNREGRLEQGETFVFGLQKPLPPGFMTQTNNARLGMGKDYDWFSPEAMDAYFKQLYSRVNTFDKANVKELLYKSELQFETAASEFRLIDDNTTSVIVNWKNSMELVERLKNEGFSYSLMKALSQFSVNVRERDLKKLDEAGAIEEVLEGIFVIRDASFYDKQIGLVTDNHWLEESLIV